MARTCASSAVCRTSKDSFLDVPTRLAAAGLSNKEIGQQLFLSHRTIASHLYRIFPKLGITARSHSRVALQDRSTQQPS